MCIGYRVGSMFGEDDQESGPKGPGAGSGDSGGQSGQVLHLIDFNPARPGQIILEMRKYWEGLRKGRSIPTRADVEPRGIRSALDYAFILERIAPGAARFRLAGRHMIDLMGMEVRGMPLCSFVNMSARGRLSDVLESVFRAPQIAELHLHSEAAYARPELKGRMLIMPLRSDLGDVTRALGCLIAEGEIGQEPRRFDITSDELTPVIPGALVLEPSPSAPGFAEPPSPWKPGTPSPAASRPQREDETPEERRARFRVVRDNT